MSKLIILGTAHAIPDEDHENTHLAIVGETRKILVDCVGNPVVRLKQAGIALNELTDLFLTHFHPDHVAGVPSLLMSMWLSDRQNLLNIHGLSHTIDRVEKMMALYDWDQWPGFFPVMFHLIPEEPLNLAFESDEFRIFTSPVSHLLPTIGLRIESMQTGRAIAYSCDTEPCDTVVRLAKQADILIHEATGSHKGHSSAAQAGEVAKRADAEHLYLIHYDPQDESLETQAQANFPGPVTRTQDFLTIDF
jgi:ribonuclease Z